MNNKDAFVNVVRKYEVSQIIKYLKPNYKILDFGAGTGIQAKFLSQNGFNVTAIDLKNSLYEKKRVFPVIDYDGSNIPFENDSFDVVLSSNVLEHVRDLELTLHEIGRILKKEGFSIHLLPSASWRLWTSLLFYLKIRPIATEIYRNFSFIPNMHGSKGNSISELYYFSKRFWDKYFEKQDIKIINYDTNKLFYTGYFQMRKILGIKSRRLLCDFLGASSHIYLLKHKK